MKIQFISLIQFRLDVSNLIYIIIIYAHTHTGGAVSYRNLSSWIDNRILIHFSVKLDAKDVNIANFSDQLRCRLLGCTE